MKVVSFSPSLLPSLPPIRVMKVAKEDSESKWDQESSGSEFGEEESLTDEQKEHKRKFREWRKKHYNEFLAVKRARELIQQVSIL